MSTIGIEIEHLVLDGVDEQAMDAQQLSSMVSRELQTLLERRGLPPGLTSVNLHSLALPGLRLPPQASGQQVAQQVALALYRGLGGGR